ncbi:MAG: RHS repeat-associated core domain-containing protein, partial [Acidobacteriota bacterium]|nr:RHS repeat-associated core domain-containing protein [Acidobacteriota bacterium]
MAMTAPNTCLLAQRPTSNLQFPGKERDAETGLDYFLARYYSGAQGRFTSPDTPLLPRIDTPQM